MTLASVIQFRKQLTEDGSIAEHQLWRVEFSDVDPGLAEIRNAKSGKLLEIYGGETAKQDLASAIQYSKYDGVSGDQSKSQLWRFKEIQYESTVDNPVFNIDRDKPIKLIYDGDMGPDPCDYATVAMLMEYHKAGKIELLGLMNAQPDPNSTPTFDNFNRYYGLNIPVSGYDETLFSWKSSTLDQVLTISNLYTVWPAPIYYDDSTLKQQADVKKQSRSDCRDGRKFP